MRSCKLESRSIRYGKNSTVEGNSFFSCASVVMGYNTHSGRKSYEECNFQSCRRVACSAALLSGIGRCSDISCRCGSSGGDTEYSAGMNVTAAQIKKLLTIVELLDSPSAIQADGAESEENTLRISEGVDKGLFSWVDVSFAQELLKEYGSAGEVCRAFQQQAKQVGSFLSRMRTLMFPNSNAEGEKLTDENIRHLLFRLNAKYDESTRNFLYHVRNKMSEHVPETQLSYYLGVPKMDVSSLSQLTYSDVLALLQKSSNAYLLKYDYSSAYLVSTLKPDLPVIWPAGAAIVCYESKKLRKRHLRGLLTMDEWRDLYRS